MQIENLEESNRVHGKDWRDEIAGRFLDLAADVIRVAPEFPRYHPGLMIANQVMRSITSCGANYDEARGAESRADFIHKILIVLKEMRESIYWLKLCGRIELGDPVLIRKLVFQATGLSNIVAKPVVTAKKSVQQ